MIFRVKRETKAIVRVTFLCSPFVAGSSEKNIEPKASQFRRMKNRKPLFKRKPSSRKRMLSASHRWLQKQTKNRRQLVCGTILDLTSFKKKKRGMLRTLPRPSLRIDSRTSDRRGVPIHVRETHLGVKEKSQSRKRKEETEEAE